MGRARSKRILCLGNHWVEVFYCGGFTLKAAMQMRL